MRALNAYDGLYKTKLGNIESVIGKRAVEQQNSARKRISLTTPSSVDNNGFDVNVNHQSAFFKQDVCLGFFFPFVVAFWKANFV